jgi:hypothetical protein
MNSLNTASLVNLLGFTVGVALYALLLVMVARHRKSKEKFSFDLLLTATGDFRAFVDVGELAATVWKDSLLAEVRRVLLAISYSALGFLPSVVVHSAWKNAESENVSARWLTFAAYGLSLLATYFHFQSVILLGIRAVRLCLRILTFGSLALLAVC